MEILKYVDRLGKTRRLEKTYQTLIHIYGSAREVDLNRFA
jgi:hypothetical protein